MLPDFRSQYRALFDAIRKIVPASMKIYLVGGAVRDIILNRKIRDFDFTVEGLVRPIGKHIADELNGAYYVLDDEREMVRVIIEDETMGEFDVDIAQLSGESIEDDLRERDFTFNAMAIELAKEPVFVDPLGGLDDLNNKRLRMCSPESLQNDPMRALRAIRMNLEFGLEPDDGLIAAMENATANLSESSFERYRDELFKIIRLYKNGSAVQLMRKFGYFEYLFPGCDKAEDGINLQFIENTDKILSLMFTNQESAGISDVYASYASARLGNYKEAMKGFLTKSLALYHNRKMLTAFASIAGSASKNNVKAVKLWCNRLTFSTSEMNFTQNVILSHAYLNTLTNLPSFGDVDIYRYFRQYREGGLSGAILFLADGYAQQEFPDAYKIWCDKVVFVQDLISAYFTRYMEVIDPKPLLSGTDIQNLLDIPAGPVIGYAKNALIEAQIRGSVKNVSEAELFIKQQAKQYTDRER